MLLPLSLSLFLSVAKLDSFDCCPSGGDAVVPFAGSTFDDQLRHSGRRLVVRMHLRRTLPPETPLLRTVGSRSTLQNIRVKTTSPPPFFSARFDSHFRFIPIYFRLCPIIFPVYIHLLPVMSMIFPVYTHLLPVMSMIFPVYTHLLPVSVHLLPVYADLLPVLPPQKKPS